MATQTVTSADGTKLAYESTGSGPPLVLVDGAMCYRAFGPSAPMAAQLAPHFTVFRYDRRGRGESGDTQPFAPEREFDDLAAVLAVAGPEARVFGVSSGAAIALETANRGVAMRKLAIYEAPYIIDATREPMGDTLARIRDAIASDRRRDAVKLFMASVGAPKPVVWVMSKLPVWKKLEAVAHTLPYDLSIMDADQQGRPFAAGRWDGVKTTTIVIDGGKSPPWMRNAQAALANAIAGAQHRTAPGQTHMVKAKVLAPLIADFFAS